VKVISIMFPEMLVFSGIMTKRSERMSRFVHAMALSCLLAAFFLITGCSLPVDNGSVASYTPGVPYSARVVHVTDGDTLNVVFPGGDQETVRILGVDTPEVTLAGTDPGSFEGVSDPVVLRSWGEVATSTLRREVEGREVAVTTDRAAGERDCYGRLLAYLQTDEGKDIGEVLLSRGLARVYTPESFARKGRYLEVQAEAKRRGIGIWSGMTPAIPGSNGVFIADVHPDAAGDDRTNLNDEYITLENGAGVPIDLAGWQVQDSDGFVGTLPEMGIYPGARIILHTGNGTANGTDLFFGSTVPLLNNDGDSITLFDPAGRAVSTRAWG
jgi:micrococcal nuclease